MSPTMTLPVDIPVRCMDTKRLRAAVWCLGSFACLLRDIIFYLGHSRSLIVSTIVSRSPFFGLQTILFIPTSACGEGDARALIAQVITWIWDYGHLDVPYARCIKRIEKQAWHCIFGALIVCGLQPQSISTEMIMQSTVNRAILQPNYLLRNYTTDFFNLTKTSSRLENSFFVYLKTGKLTMQIK